MVNHLQIDIYTKKFLNNNQFQEKKLLVTVVTNLDTNLQNKKLLVIIIVTIMNKKI